MERTPEGVIDFNQFKKKKEDKEVKPFFTQPTSVTLANPETGEQKDYLLLVNLVYNGKQIIALESSKPEEVGIAIVEAVIEDDTFVGVQAIETEEEYNEVAQIISDVFNAIQEEGQNADH